MNCGPGQDSGVLGDLINECSPSGSRNWNVVRFRKECVEVLDLSRGPVARPDAFGFVGASKNG